MYIDSSNTSAGLFANNEGTIQNLKISDSYIHIKNEMTATYYGVGGVVGINLGTVKKCSNTGEIFYEGLSSEIIDYVGGIIGYSNGEIDTCDNTGNIQFSVSGKYSRVGGVCGTAAGSLKNSTNKANITGETMSVDGRIGGCVGIANSGYVENIENSGKIEVDGKNTYINGVTCIGGAIGQAYDNSTVINAKNSGKINLLRANANYVRVGGVLGMNSSSTISNCANYGDIDANVTTTTSSYIGGISASNYMSSIINNCKSAGKISYNVSGNMASIGGIVGSNDETSTLRYSYTSKNIEGISNCSSYTNIGRIIGINNSECTVTNCYTTGGMNNTGTSGTRRINFFYGYNVGTINKVYYLSETTTEGYDYSVRNFAGTTSNMTKNRFITEIGSNAFKIGTEIYPVLTWE